MRIESRLVALLVCPWNGSTGTEGHDASGLRQRDVAKEWRVDGSRLIVFNLGAQRLSFGGYRLDIGGYNTKIGHTKLKVQYFGFGILPGAALANV
jgi:hypothetical protein